MNFHYVRLGAVSNSTARLATVILLRVAHHVVTRRRRDYMPVEQGGPHRFLCNRIGGHISTSAGGVSAHTAPHPERTHGISRRAAFKGQGFEGMPKTLGEGN